MAYRMTSSRIAQVALAAVVISAFAPSAKALPFKSDCRSMAQYAAGLARQQTSNGTRYSFKGFSGPISKRADFSDLVCDGGFIVKSSPKGTLVCNGYIHYTAEDKMLRWASGSFTDLVNETQAERRRIAYQQQDFELGRQRMQLRAQGLSTAGLDMRQRLDEADRRFNEKRIQLEQESPKPAPCRWQ